MFMQFKVWKDVNERGKGGREKEDERHRGHERRIYGCQRAHVYTSVLAVRQATTAPTFLSPYSFCQAPELGSSAL